VKIFGFKSTNGAVRYPFSKGVKYDDKSLPKGTLVPTDYRPFFALRSLNRQSRFKNGHFFISITVTGIANIKGVRILTQNVHYYIHWHSSFLGSNQRVLLHGSKQSSYSGTIFLRVLRSPLLMGRTDCRACKSQNENRKSQRTVELPCPSGSILLNKIQIGLHSKNA